MSLEENIQRLTEVTTKQVALLEKQNELLAKVSEQLSWLPWVNQRIAVPEALATITNVRPINENPTQGFVEVHKTHENTDYGYKAETTSVSFTVPAPAPKPETPKVPEPVKLETPKAVTFEQVKAFAVEFKKAKGADALSKLLEKFKVISISQLDPKNFAPFFAELSANL